MSLTTYIVINDITFEVYFSPVRLRVGSFYCVGRDPATEMLLQKSMTNRGGSYSPDYGKKRKPESRAGGSHG